jgi:two-component system sensor histidine kinase CpxA
MAGRIEELLSRQRQLIYDISHELCSPLSRLTVALDFGRERKGPDAAFDHMERDLERLNEMIGRLLTIARLDTAAIPVEMSPLDLTELVARVVHDAGFESRKRDVVVTLKSEEQFIVRGNAELLLSAIENVIRNAIYYTTTGASVDVVLHGREANATSIDLLTVRDFGAGVSPFDLVNIFQPFYHAAVARDRASSDVGLGLAIADRVIRIHSGTISAENALPYGLRVNISILRDASV